MVLLRGMFCDAINMFHESAAILILKPAGRNHLFTEPYDYVHMFRILFTISIQIYYRNVLGKFLFGGDVKSTDNCLLYFSLVHIAEKFALT